MTGSSDEAGGLGSVGGNASQALGWCGAAAGPAVGTGTWAGLRGRYVLGWMTRNKTETRC